VQISLFSHRYVLSSSRLKIVWKLVDGDWQCPNTHWVQCGALHESATHLNSYGTFCELLFFWSSNGTVCELRFFLEQQWCSQCFSFLPFVALTWCSCLDTEPISSYSFSRLSCTLIFINSRLWVYYFWEKILLV